MAFAHAGLPALRTKCRASSSDQRFVACSEHRFIVSTALSPDGYNLAEHLSRRILWAQSPACGVGRLDCRTKGRPGNILWSVDAAGVRSLCERVQSPKSK